MNFLELLFNGSSLVREVGDAIDKNFTSDEERLEKQNELYKADREYNLSVMKTMATLDAAQMEVNKVEAASGNLFVAGWRPAIGWVGALALGYQFLVFPVIKLFMPNAQPLDASLLWTIIAGMLGIGTMRSFDKWQGVDTKKIG